VELWFLHPSEAGDT